MKNAARHEDAFPEKESRKMLFLAFNLSAPSDPIYNINFLINFRLSSGNDHKFQIFLHLLDMKSRLLILTQ